ncbi:MAG TPA: hypothetical protein VHS59_07015, partial [Bacillota bacterium]|nr:hypothetical protein [Bacillota bacterium]
MKRQTPLMVSLLLGLLFSQAGCWDYTEYEDMAQITGIGIDYDRRTGETTMTVQYTPTTKGQSSGGPGAPGSAPSTQVVHAAKGRTVYEALPKLQQAISKRLFYGYLRTLVLGQEAARYNLLDFLELHQRTPAIR